MKPILEENKNTKIKVFYFIVIIICVIIISIAVYFQFFSEEKMGVIFGISTKDDETSINLEENFNSLFSNNFEILDNTEVSSEKIEEKDYIYTKFKKNLQKDDFIINVSIPFININEDIPKKFNEEIQNAFKLKTESLIQNTNEKIFYTVNYKAYIQKDILSLIIKSELKENDSIQRIIVQTYNYNLKDKKEVNLEEVLNIKNINYETVDNKIRKTIKTKQQKNKNLAELGYNLYERDYKSSEYDIKNSRQFLFGKDEVIYVVYAYGNDDFTNEMDLVIF